MDFEQSDNQKRNDVQYNTVVNQLQAVSEDKYPMKWHRFISRFGLWACALVSLLAALISVIGIEDMRTQAVCHTVEVLNYFNYLGIKQSVGIILYHDIAFAIIAIFSAIAGVGLMKCRKFGVYALLIQQLIIEADIVVFRLLLWSAVNDSSSPYLTKFPFFAILYPLSFAFLIMLLQYRYYKKRIGLFS